MAKQKAILQHAETHQTEEKSNVLDLVEVLNEKNFFDSESKGRFVPKKLGDYIMKEHHFRCAGEMLWVYRDGVYRPDGEKIATQKGTQLLGNDYAPSRISHTIKYLKVRQLTEVAEPNYDVINLSNGRYNLREKKLMFHDHKIFETIQLPVAFNPEAECPEFNKYLESTFDQDMIPLIEELLGLILVPDTRFEKAFMLHGSGANGKSVLLDIMIALLGRENISSVPIQDLESNRFKAAELLGKLANIFPDLSDKDLTSTGLFKALVSGEILTAERKFEQQFQFKNTARLIFSCNKIPRSKDNSDGYWRRWIIIPFTRQFRGSSADKDLKAKLTAPEELSGILNRALSGLARLHENMTFTDTPLNRYAKARLILESNTLGAFMEQCAEVHPDQEITKQDFFSAYVNWCMKENVSPISEKALKDIFQKDWPQIRSRRKNNRSPWSWKGLGLKTESDSADGGGSNDEA